MASGDRNYDIATETTQDELKSLLEEIKAKLDTSHDVVRHIQRGKITFSSDASTVTIPLSGFTNANKMIVLLNGSDYYSSSSSGNYMSENYDYYIESLTATALVVSRYNHINVIEREGSYQVIEFY